MMGDRDVAIAALHAWNNLPNAIHCRPNAIS